jgi:hypothetical protein
MWSTVHQLCTELIYMQNKAVISIRNTTKKLYISKKKKIAMFDYAI